MGGSAGKWYGASGAADLADGRPPRTGDRIRIGSVSKAFVAAVVLQLVAQRRLAPHDTVQGWLPGLMPGRFPAITVEQLLNHTSGLPDATGPEPVTPEEIAAYRDNRLTPRQMDDAADRRHGDSALSGRTRAPAGRSGPV
ncbi:serine hydrolase domain-containing protein [Streptomyces sp. NBC_00859]|uniref:serine hydrolase domain-containing protein n=1 Tax=Streptomyces sp. NBC_00859 TaxID=2903682 RepID=UPI003868D8DA|nr:beta-lactamase family protein [Streptomyces sp. NBC_00859]